MGKDRNGTFVPPKGKPSGEGKSKGGPKTVYNLDNLEERDEIADKYTDGPDDPAANVAEANPNRNVDKSEYRKNQGYGKK